jgi:hypothetical protein
MRPQQEATRNGRPSPTSQSATVPSELDRLRATCRREAHAIYALTDAVSVLRTPVAILKAENGDLRVANDRVRTRGRGDSPEALEARLALDVHASAAARIVVRQCLGDRAAVSLIAGPSGVAAGTRSSRNGKPGEGPQRPSVSGGPRKEAAP